MKSYIDAIEHEIMLENKRNLLSLIRLEEINSPIIYMEVCKYLKNILHDTKLIAKLSKEKYDDFIKEKRDEWKQALDFLVSNDYIDTNGAMTAWRNNTPDLKNLYHGQKVIVLLMGTEVVPDKGGLADFYYIGADTILKKLKKDYSYWFKELFDNKGFNSDDLKAIHTLFKAIFNSVNIDLIKFSCIIDDLNQKSIYTVDELIEEICYRLNKDWGIPAIQNTKKVPKSKKLRNGKLSSADIITKAHGFITRQIYKNGLTNSNYNKLLEKIDKYAEENVDDLDIPFPNENPQFNSFKEFKSVIVDYVLGKNYQEIRERLMNVDFSIIDDILNIKISGRTISKGKSNKILGNPIEIYTEMILQVILNYKTQYNELPKTIKIKVNDIKLSNCSTDLEKMNLYNKICIYLGGILDFINESNFLSAEGIELLYEEVSDPFNYINKDNISITKTAKMNELSKINFTVRAINDNEENVAKQEFIFLFQSNAPWIQTFSLLKNDDSLIDFESNYIKLPLYASCSQINDYTCCESDEEFFIKIEKIKLGFEYEEYLNKLTENFLSNDIRNAIGLLEIEYKNFLVKLINEGYFRTIANNGGCNKVFNRYVELLNLVKDSYDQLTSSQREKIYMILNMFMISGVTFESFIENNIDSIIVPPYNPIMLEKVYYQMNFIRYGFDEVLSLISSGQVIAIKDVQKRLNYFSKTCVITSGFDMITVGNMYQLLTNKMHQYYAIYNSEKRNYNLISEKVFENELLDDEELDKKELIRKSQKSDILSKNIEDYINTFPSTLDGINILFINPDDMQHIVAGIHDVIDKIKEKGQKGKINLRIIVSDKRKNGADYLKYWLDAFFEDEKQIEINTYLNYMDLSSSKVKENIEKYVEKQDIVFIYKILENSTVEFKKTNIENIVDEYKYPAIVTPLPISITQSSRGVDISQRQFNCSNEHLQLLHKYIRPDAVSGSYKVIKGLTISDTSRVLIDEIHEKCKWVICIDEAIDREILNDDYRKIIGFSTGQGAFGELNVTVSAREDIIEDIRSKLKQRLISKFSRWSTDRVEDAAKYCIELTKDLDGSRMLRALNPSDYEIHNFLAYVLTIQNLHLNEHNNKYLIRNLINLDTHKHWFDTNLRDNNLGSYSRPDFLLVEVENNEENLKEGINLKIRATVIECKMGFENPEHINNAKEQLKHGIKVLANNFDSNTIRVNKRYWFNQLYRSLVFSEINLEDNNPEYKLLVDKISDIYNGNFDIEWNGSIFAYWLDQDDSNYRVENIECNDDEFEFKVNNIKLYTAGQLFIQKLLVPASERNEEFEFNEIETIDIKEEFLEEIIDDINEIEFPIINETKLNEDIEEKSTPKDEQEDKTSSNKVNVNADKQTNNRDFNSSVDNKIKEKMQDVAAMDKQETITLDGEEKEEPVVQKNKDLKDIRFLLGKDSRTGDKMYWEFGHTALNNRHLLINGNSGSGKTYCIQTLIMEAVKNNISVIVFDYTDGFTESKLDKSLKDFLGNKLVERSVKYEKFPINPFKRHKVIHGNKEFDEFDADIANRIASSFKAVYNFGDQQRNVVYEAVAEGLDKYKDNMNFKVMADLINESKNPSASTVYSKIKPFIDYDPFLTGNEFSWEDMLKSKGELYIIQLSGFDREIQVMLTEIILWDIWSYATRFGNEDNPMPIVLDEAHNLSHDSSSPSGRILAEGRKFGISGWYATQFMKGRLKSESIGNLQQAAQKLYFSPPEESIVEVSKYIDITNEGSKAWAEKLKKLTKGNCVTCGFRMKNNKFDKYEPTIISITSLEERIND